MESVRYKARIERKQPQLPRYVVIPARIPEAWKRSGTTTITGTVNGFDLGRRGLKPWGDGKRWFFELPEPICRQAGADTGDEVVLIFAPAEDKIPMELSELLAANVAFAGAWRRLPLGRQRELAEWVASAKKKQTRTRRAHSFMDR